MLVAAGPTFDLSRRRCVSPPAARPDTIGLVEAAVMTGRPRPASAFELDVLGFNADAVTGSLSSSVAAPSTSALVQGDFGERIESDVVRTSGQDDVLVDLGEIGAIGLERSSCEKVTDVETAGWLDSVLLLPQDDSAPLCEETSSCPLPRHDKGPIEPVFPQTTQWDTGQLGVGDSRTKTNSSRICKPPSKFEMRHSNPSLPRGTSTSFPHLPRYNYSLQEVETGDSGSLMSLKHYWPETHRQRRNMTSHFVPGIFPNGTPRYSSCSHFPQFAASSLSKSSSGQLQHVHTSLPAVIYPTTVDYLIPPSSCTSRPLENNELTLNPYATIDADPFPSGVEGNQFFDGSRSNCQDIPSLSKNFPMSEGSTLCNTECTDGQPESESVFPHPSSPVSSCDESNCCDEYLQDEQPRPISCILDDIHDHSKMSQETNVESLPSLKVPRNRKFRRRGSLVTHRKQSVKRKAGRTKKLCKEKVNYYRTCDNAVPAAREDAAIEQPTFLALPNLSRQESPTISPSTPDNIVSRQAVSGRQPVLGTVGRPGPCISRASNSGHSSPPSGGDQEDHGRLLRTDVGDRTTKQASGYTRTSSGVGHKGERNFKLHNRRSGTGNARRSTNPGGFTVVPVNNETHLREQAQVKSQSQTDHNGSNSSNNLRVPMHTFDINTDGEPTDTLTQNSITSLLSAKFRDVAKRWKQYGVESPRFRKRLHSKWESLNYDIIDSELQKEQTAHGTSKKRLALTWLGHWMIYFFIGIGTAFLAAGVQVSVEIIAHQKFELVRDYLDRCSEENCLIKPVLIWVGINLGITLLGAALVTYVQPMAAGSGIPLIKSYLNGVRVPGLLSLRAFIAKCIGVILSILGGLACGKEGPMAHSGGIIGAGLGKGRIPWFKKDINLYGVYRNDHNIRDLVAAGAASGVSAAFGAPVGGTLFSVEEAASFWNTELVWKVFFSAMIACFSTNVLLSAFEGHPTQLSNPGLVRFNTFPNLTFDLIEIPVFILMAAIGGLTGSLFVVLNYKLTVFRQKYLHQQKWIKVLEAGLVSVVSAVVAFILMFAVNDCTTAEPRSHHAITSKMGCSGTSHNAMSSMFLTTPEGCLKSLLHDPLETYSVLSLILFIVIFFLLGVWTYGLSVSSGVFIPSLAIGAAWGRLIGMGVVQLFPDQAKDVGKYALIGAASQLGGILRTTISLTVIIVECTGDITFGLCIMISLMISKWVGDFFTTGLYDMNVEVSGIPLLSWEPPPLCDHVSVSDFMSQPVMSLLPVEKVGHIVDCLSGETFHGFPVIQQDPAYDLMYKGKLKGLILRHQILVLLQNRVFCPEGQLPKNSVTLADFDNPYPNVQRIEDVELSEEDKECVMDVTPYMNQMPYVVSPNFSMPRVFRLFRGLGLRHLVVVNDNFEPMGMVTRKDLAKYRAQIKKGMLHMEQLTVENR